MKRFILCIIVLCIALAVLGLAEEDDVSLNDALKTDATQKPTDESFAKIEKLIKYKAKNAIEYNPDGSFSIIISAAGDLTVGQDIRLSGESLYSRELAKYNGDVCFITKNVEELFSQDHLTIVNFNAAISNAPIPANKKNKEEIFSADVACTEALVKGNIEAVTLENEHVMDQGKAGFQDTVRALEAANIVWSSTEKPGVYEVNGVQIAILSYKAFEHMEGIKLKVSNDIRDARASYDIVIVSYHWGNKNDYSPSMEQQKLAQATIDAGADLVIGHHSERINPIELYKGKYIVYSLGSLSNAGDIKPSDMNTFIFQAKFTIRDRKAETETFRIIPARISSKTGYNDLIPTLYEDSKSIKNVIALLKKNGQRLEFAVEEYPTDWE